MTLSSLLTLRSGIYRCLSLAFRPPQARRVARILLNGPALLDEIVAVVPFAQLRETRTLLGQLARDLDGSTHLQLRLAEEYARLFADRPRGLGPPREAAFMNGRAATAVPTSVAALYAAAQFAPGRPLAGAPDHIAVELTFMARLCQRQLQAVITADANEAARLGHVQQAFLGQHLKPWASTLADEVKAVTREQFYQALSMLLAAWMGLDWALLSALAAAPSSEIPRKPIGVLVAGR